MRFLERVTLPMHLIALALAVGAPVFFAAVVAPSAFAVLPAKALAGDLIGRVLVSLCLILQGCFAVLFATEWALTSRAPRTRASTILRRLPVLGFFSALVTGDLIIPIMDRIRRAIPLAAGSGDPRWQTFSRYHAMSVAFLGLDLVCALVLLLATGPTLHRAAVPPVPPAGSVVPPGP